MAYRTIRLDIAEGIATLTLNRPERKNALDMPIRVPADLRESHESR